jgi:regulation of enolase protein 1 (concanavalin A-like superfamily)
MKSMLCLFAALALMFASRAAADELLFQDDFAGKLGDGWSWVREDKPAWRVTDKGLELRLLPGNLWGRANDARNVLVRPAPDTTPGEVEVVVAVSHQPVHQYQQANLAWYYDDSNMVKLGLELVDGQACIVMGREQADKTRTLAKIPIAVTSVRLRLRVAGNQIRGQYLPAGTEKWLDAATGDLPVPPNAQAKISLHCYQGPPDAELWARFRAFQIWRITKAQ